MRLISLFIILTVLSTPIYAKPSLCEKKLEVAEGVIIECNDKVKEFDSHVKILSLRISEQKEFIDKQEAYIDELEAYAKANDAQSWWHRNKMLIGFIGGILLTTGLVVGVSQVTK